MFFAGCCFNHKATNVLNVNQNRATSGSLLNLGCPGSQFWTYKSSHCVLFEAWLKHSQRFFLNFCFLLCDRQQPNNMGLLSMLFMLFIQFQYIHRECMDEHLYTPHGRNRNANVLDFSRGDQIGLQIWKGEKLSVVVLIMWRFVFLRHWGMLRWWEAVLGDHSQLATIQCLNPNKTQDWLSQNLQEQNSQFWHQEASSCDLLFSHC